MGVAKRTRKFATVKRVISQRDARLKKNQIAHAEQQKKRKTELIREMYVWRELVFAEKSLAYSEKQSTDAV